MGKDRKKERQKAEREKERQTDRYQKDRQAEFQIEELRS